MFLVGGYLGGFLEHLRNLAILGLLRTTYDSYLEFYT
jgi:hypothetical protein